MRGHDANFHFALNARIGAFKVFCINLAFACTYCT